ncbi:MAG TPA: hypothetical protein DCG19_04590 [Cryomorphaceae bacterium]|nr:hypothetical protein [Owenweeksia sp.]MBF99323.1 hypothetical protein [Owenweeksia sp.]HAD96660.1 hypothetical protein [Cryomorphaceae bacterium]HBF19802.1 hypothetical protein [Cryomorphaceae bacterium]HCQ17173.1 hypothetical protein [Cryomorphaceae bacterium]|tara:strand:+ start:30238 stop:31977 length:1740 start_codon:yes stop_codon:yes gene_type:complete
MENKHTISGKGSFLPYFILLATIALGHFPLLLSDSILGDSIINYHLALTNHHKYIQAFYNAYALPIHGYIAYLVSFFPAIFYYKLTAFIFLILIAAFLYHLFSTLKLFSQRDNLLTSLLAITFPVYTMWNEITTLPYLISYAFFLAGFCLYIYSSRLIYFILCLILWSVAFQLSSLLLLFYVVVAGIWLQQEKVSLGDFRSWLLACRDNLLLLLFPIFYFLFLNLFFPGNSYQYNTIDFSGKKLLKNTVISFYGTCIEPFSHFFHFASIDAKTALFIIAIVTVVLFIIYRIIRQNFENQTHRKRNANIQKVLYALLLIFCAAIPYLLVGKPIRGFAYESRHALLLGPGFAILLFIFLQRYFEAKGTLATWLVIGLFTSMNLVNHILWQNRSIKIQAIAENLPRTTDTSDRVLFFYDKVPLGSRFKIKEIELHYCAIQTSGIYNQYPYLLNTDYTSLVKRIYSPPINWYKVFCYPWIMDQAKNQDLLISPRLEQRLMKRTQRKHITKINRTYRDIHLNGFTDNIYDASQATGCIVHELMPGRELKEGEIFLQYISGSSAERKELLQSLIYVKTHHIEWEN